MVSEMKGDAVWVWHTCMACYALWLVLLLLIMVGFHGFYRATRGFAGKQCTVC